VRQLSQGGYIAAGRGSSGSGGQGLLIKYAPETGIEANDVSPAVDITSVSPNPFSSSLRITYSLPSTMSASITVYGLDGRVVDIVEAGTFQAGEHTVSWIPSSELASGCYLIRLQTDTGVHVRNCVLLRE
ncbi:MAG: T9SS type A sorting domain-containing protein, partial [Candidatus Fermentibacteria bacterium]|nr:T9SS type A sorting domain-containing protein [Candidatus Fermentibacteria bacterium]